MPDEQQGIIGQVKKWVETWFLRRTGPQYFDGNLTLSGTLTANGNVTIDDAAVLAVERINAFDGTGLSLYDDGDNLGVHVADGGNVGIGEASPTTDKLDVFASNANIVQLHRSGVTPVYRFAISAGGTWSLYDITNAADRLLVDSSGNVGIGVTPGYLVHAQKDQNGTTAFTVENNTSGTGAQAQIRVEGVSNAYAALGKYSPTTTTYKVVKASDAYIYGYGNGDIVILNDYASGNIIFAAGASSTAQVIIDSSGNVGIGVTPKGILDVWDGTSGHMIVTKTAVDSTPVEVLPNATGGMAEGAHVRSVVVRSGVSEMNSVSISPGATGVDIFNDATNVWQLQSPAAGSKQLLVVRSAGTGTANITLDIIWQ